MSVLWYLPYFSFGICSYRIMRVLMLMSSCRFASRIFKTVFKKPSRTIPRWGRLQNQIYFILISLGMKGSASHASNV